MSVILNEIYRSVVRQYPIELIAGEKGLSNEVKWVHMVENKEISSFLDGKEIVFTTGIVTHTNEELFELIKENIKNDASGMVINIGPYISGVTSEMIQYCNDKNFPLFVVPWEVKMARIMKVFYFYIIDVEKKQVEITSAIKNVIFSSEQTKLYMPVLKDYGFQEESTYTVAVIHFYETLDDASFNKLKREIDFILQLLYERAVIVKVDNSFVILFAEVATSKIKHTMKRISLMMGGELTRRLYLLAVGSAVHQMTSIKTSYQQALNMINMSGKKDLSTDVLYYDEVGVYKVLFEIKNTEVVQDYITNTIQILFDYDQLNDTDYTKLLRLYLQYNGAVNRLAEELYVHRNTINYRINKIEEITKRDLSDFNTRLELDIALKLKDIY